MVKSDVGYGVVKFGDRVRCTIIHNGSGTKTIREGVAHYISVSGSVDDVCGGVLVPTEGVINGSVVIDILDRPVVNGTVVTYMWQGRPCSAIFAGGTWSWTTLDGESSGSWFKGTFDASAVNVKVVYSPEN